MPKAAFHVFSPQKLQSGVVFASPHSGKRYPQSFVSKSILSPLQLRSSEDAFVDQLFAAAPDHGAPLLTALLPRAYLDLNRAADELDPAVIEGVQRKVQNPRIASGLGVIPRVVAHGQAIYRGKLPLVEAQRRIESCWVPYHGALMGMLQQAKREFGQAVLVDCHSMPHEAVEAMARRGDSVPDIVLGDRFGASASPEVMDYVESAFVGAGLTVSRNTPFAGAYITQAYGRPSRGQHAIQVEIDRSLYMDETTVTPNSNFTDLKELIGEVISELCQMGAEQLPLAAE